jgi:asparagine synthase (glutamine-hydrolysing)
MGGYIPMAENGGLFENMLTSAKLILHYHPFLSLFRRIVGTVRRHRGIEFLKRNTPSVRNELSFPCANDRLPADWGAVNHMLYPMFHSTVLPTILRNFDRMSMAHGVEVRMPFMDWRLVTYVFSLPDASKVGGGFTKRVARLGMAGKMPDSIRLSKRKIGFGSPLPAWFNGPLESWIRGLLDRGREHDLIDMPRFQKFVEENMDKHSWTWQNAEIAWRHLHYLWFEQEYVKR